MRLLAIKNILAMLFVGFLSLSLDATDAHANAAWKNMQGQPKCGGIDSAGRLQAPCGSAEAIYLRDASLTCPKGTFLDLDAGAGCWQCPDGYERNSWRKISHERACAKPAPVQFSSAKFVQAANRCAKGTFFDPREKGECWRCDAGFIRTLGVAVTEWNACMKLGEKAREATFVTKICPQEGENAGSFYDPRNGGECWKCPPDYNRNGNPVTGGRACDTDRTFSPAINKSDFLCRPGEIFDLTDFGGKGGSCWKCPQDYKRTWDGIRTKTACRNDGMEWTMPKRQVYGLYGLGWGGNDILAQIMADRTAIDEFIKKFAAEKGIPESTALKESWDAINNTPWDSPVLSSLLQQAAMAAAIKPVNQRTEAEKDFVARVEQLIQWNRQFVAYQAKQAHTNWVQAQQTFFNESLQKMGAAAVYADSIITPPNYNDTLVAYLQAGTMVAGPAAVYLTTSLFPPIMNALRPFAKGAASKVTTITSATGGTLTPMGAAAAAGPMIIAAAAAVIVQLEIDKFMALAKAESQIAAAIRKADSPVNLGTLLQSPGGPDEFFFHWATVIGEKTKPTPDFTARYNAYKAGKGHLAGKPATPIAVSASVELSEETKAMLLTAEQMGDVNAKVQANANVVSQMFNFGPMANATPSTGLATGPVTTSSTATVTPSTSATAPQSNTQVARPKPRTMAELLERAVKTQKPRPPSGGMRLESSNNPNNCMTKYDGTAVYMTVTQCGDRRAMWIVPHERSQTLMFDKDYCLDADIPRERSAKENEKKPKSNRPPREARLKVSECNSRDAGQKWQLTQQGHIQQINTDQCLALRDGGMIVLQTCGTNSTQEIWRPWAGR